MMKRNPINMFVVEDAIEAPYELSIGIRIRFNTKFTITAINETAINSFKLPFAVSNGPKM